MYSCLASTGGGLGSVGCPVPCHPVWPCGVLHCIILVAMPGAYLAGLAVIGFMALTGQFATHSSVSYLLKISCCGVVGFLCQFCRRGSSLSPGLGVGVLSFCPRSLLVQAALVCSVFMAPVGVLSGSSSWVSRVVQCQALSDFLPCMSRRLLLLVGCHLASGPSTGFVWRASPCPVESGLFRLLHVLSPPGRSALGVLQLPCLPGLCLH